MKQMQKNAVILSLINRLKEKGSWCGGTNIQKASYFLQEMLGVELGFDFILYKYGPYSFELTDELTAMRANSFLHLEIRDPRYSPCYVLMRVGRIPARTLSENGAKRSRENRIRRRSIGRQADCPIGAAFDGALCPKKSLRPRPANGRENRRIQTAYFARRRAEKPLKR